MQRPVNTRPGTRNIGDFGTRLARPSVESAKEWLASGSLKQEVQQRLRLHFLLKSQIILDTSPLGINPAHSLVIEGN
jgi:hypothetical protein